MGNLCKNGYSKLEDKRKSAKARLGKIVAEAQKNGFCNWYAMLYMFIWVACLGDGIAQMVLSATGVLKAFVFVTLDYGQGGVYRTTNVTIDPDVSKVFFSFDMINAVGTINVIYGCAIAFMWVKYMKMFADLEEMIKDENKQKLASFYTLASFACMFVSACMVSSVALVCGIHQFTALVLFICSQFAAIALEMNWRKVNSELPAEEEEDESSEELIEPRQNNKEERKAARKAKAEKEKEKAEKEAAKGNCCYRRGKRCCMMTVTVGFWSFFVRMLIWSFQGMAIFFNLYYGDKPISTGVLALAWTMYALETVKTIAGMYVAYKGNKEEVEHMNMHWFDVSIVFIQISVLSWMICYVTEIF